MENSVEHLLAVAIKLTHTLYHVASNADSYRMECAELKGKSALLAQRLRSVAHASNDSARETCRRPILRIMQELQKSVSKALALVQNCRKDGMLKTVFKITFAGNDFKRVNLSLDNAIANVTWLLNILAVGENKIELMGFPPITASDPRVGLIWEQIALLQCGSENQRMDAANLLGCLARQSDELAKIIVEEDGVAPLLKVVTHEIPGAREAAARTLGHIAKVANNQQQAIADIVAPVFAKLLISAPMKVQIALAWALGEIVRYRPIDVIWEHDAISSLVALLCKTLEQPENAEQAFSMAAPRQRNPGGIDRQQTAKEFNRKNDNPEVQAELKAEVAHALWMLAKGNPRASRTITETKALQCFATVIEKCTGDAQFNAIMAVTEIAAVAEEDVVLRRAAFKMKNPAVKAVVNQLVRLVEQAQPDLLLPCIRAIGCLARTFSAKDTGVVKSLIKHLEGTDTVATEAAMALAKFVCDENYLHVQHSQTIVEASAVRHLVHLLYFGKSNAKIYAAIVMCYLTLNDAENEGLAGAMPLPVVKQVARTTSSSQSPILERLLDKLLEQQHSPFRNV